MDRRDAKTARPQIDDALDDRLIGRRAAVGEGAATRRDRNEAAGRFREARYHPMIGDPCRTVPLLERGRRDDRPWQAGRGVDDRAVIDVCGRGVNLAIRDGQIIRVPEPSADDRHGCARGERGLELIYRIGIIGFRKCAAVVRVVVGVDAGHREFGNALATMRRLGIGEFSCRGQEIDAIDEAHASLPLLILGHLPLTYCHMKNMASSKAASPTDDQRRPIDAIICMVTGQFTHISRSSPDASWNNDLGEICAAGRQKQGD